MHRVFTFEIYKLVQFESVSKTLLKSIEIFGSLTQFSQVQF